ncbi:MAG: D-ala-D-ala transporter subunit [Thermoplasmata archaeon M11B2D]|nr:MAG: D-ala-D-ala transporter subunit [Thermoplasmata archaeon M11B2D]PNX53383.1 MAG: D-ala-D-ala transporter subunit [Thermoplasmata archaeon M9B2D]
MDDFLKKHESKIKDLRFMAHLFRKSLLSMIGLVLILILILVALFAPFIASQHPSYVQVSTDQGTTVTEERWAINFSQSLLPPSPEHLFGTDDYGRDIFSMVVYGSQTSFRICIIVVAISTLIGIILGGIAGYFGGIIDEVLMRITDVFLAIPYLILAMAVAAALGRSIDHIMEAMIIVWWPTYARLFRGQVLAVREQQFVEAARSVGAGNSRILFRHIFPNSFAPLLVEVTLDLGAVLLVAAGLSFIGLGASPGTAEWGLMISSGRIHMFHAWWYVTFPGLAILLVVLGFNLLGDGLRDVTDPKLRR